MTVCDLLRTCRNGVKIEIEEYIYSSDGDCSAVVFEGIVGSFGKTGYEQEEVAYISVRSGVILIVISKVK